MHDWLDCNLIQHEASEDHGNCGSNNMWGERGAFRHSLWVTSNLGFNIWNGIIQKGNTKWRKQGQLRPHWQKRCICKGNSHKTSTMSAGCISCRFHARVVWQTWNITEGKMEQFNKSARAHTDMNELGSRWMRHHLVQQAAHDLTDTSESG